MQTLEITVGIINNGQSRDTDGIGHIRHRTQTKKQKTKQNKNKTKTKTKTKQYIKKGNT
jgi:hypothetical protein